MVAHRELKNKPLLEAILEVRWQLVKSDAGEEKDPHYKLILGRLYDRLQPIYPEHQPLSTASVPDELVGHVVQHRFRVATDDWPLVQIGPGILTFNETKKYRWENFRRNIEEVFNKLYKAHPKIEDFKIQQLSLRYVDAVAFDFRQANVFDFLKDKLKITLQLPGDLFSDAEVDSLPMHLIWQTTFRSRNPSGVVKLNFATGQKDGSPAIIWETTVISAGDDLPSLPDDFSKWLESAHKITSDWFFKLIDGDLERRFAGE
ncbi:MAG: TIGR04255 family protein [Pirellulales bacterium]|nr:TIGR04255 family protein [Pirellulales bacterium]